MQSTKVIAGVVRYTIMPYAGVSSHTVKIGVFINNTPFNGGHWQWCVVEQCYTALLRASIDTMYGVKAAHLRVCS